MNEKLTIAVCEDSKQEEEKLLCLLNKSKIQSIAAVYKSGEALLTEYEVGKYDLLLMDIYMGGMTGVQAVAKIREIDEEIPIAFITNSTEHTLESYRLSALKYIEKPFCEKDIEEILSLALMKKANIPSLLVQRNKETEKIPFSKILYLEQQNHQLAIIFKNGDTLHIYDKLTDILPQLEGQSFFIPHKSYAVHLPYVCNINKELRCFSMINGKNIPIRRESMSKAKKALECFLFDTTRGIIE